MLPRPRLILLITLATLPCLVALAGGMLFPLSGRIAAQLRDAGWLANLLIGLVALVDLLLSPTLRRVQIQREASEVMSVGARNPVTLWFLNQNRHPVTLELFDDPPAPHKTDDLPATIELPPRVSRGLTYHIEPLHRGPNRFGTLALRCRTRWGLWTLTEDRPLPQPVKIYPDIKAVHGMELLARRNRLAETGLKMSRLRGRGNDFDRLREYRREDEYRHIDWKATARQRKLISREYVVEKNQNILFVLDCGRSMCNSLDGITHLDRGLNAAIALAYVALRQGDYVGFLAVSNQVERWVRPLRGAGSIQTLIRHTYDLQPRFAATDYTLLVEELRRRNRKRSLVVVVTHALDELHLESIGRHLRQLRSPHLVLGAFIRNVPLHDRMLVQPRTDLESFQVAAAAEMIGAQTRQIANLSQQGLLVLDTLPDQLSASVISRYLDIKARHLL